jgi:coenzyme PQQ precursor peptide PqqA
MIPASSIPSMRRPEMKWTKPAFKTLELASEVTAYRYTR